MCTGRRAAVAPGMSTLLGSPGGGGDHPHPSLNTGPLTESLPPQEHGGDGGDPVS